MATAAKLDAHGHKDWRVPTKSELNVLLKNCASLGGFDKDEEYHWTSTEVNNVDVWNQRFNDGSQPYFNKTSLLDVRCVRR